MEGQATQNHVIRAVLDAQMTICEYIDNIRLGFFIMIHPIKAQNNVFLFFLFFRRVLRAIRGKFLLLSR
jgi:hypothetical protein